MKATLILLLAVSLLTACKKDEPTTTPVTETTTKSPAQLGQEIFEGRGNCYACHKPDQKVVGPSLQDIARTYKAKKGNLVAFLKEEAEPLVDPSQYEAMKVNLQLTKTYSDEDLKGLEAYILSFE